MKKPSKKLAISAIVILVIVVILFIVIKVTGKKGVQDQRTAVASKKDVIQEVTFTGNLQPAQTANLGFETIGTVTGVYAKNGDSVKKGQKLVQLDTTSAALAVAQAQAALASGNDQAYIAWQTSEQSLNDTKVLNKKTVERYRQAVIDAKIAWDQSKEAYQQTKDEYGDDSSVTKTKYSSVLVAESTYNTAQKALREATETSNKTNNAATKATELAKAQYLATSQSSSKESGMSSLEAAVAIAETNLRKSTLYAPFSGIISKKDIEVGSIATIGTPIFTIQGDGPLEVVADVPETDAVKISVGQRATITFDAFSQTENWNGTVASVSPAAKTVGGVPTFEIKISIDNPAEKFKSGLTTNITVHTARVNSVVAVPRRTIITKNEKQYATFVGSDGKTEEKEVKTGLLGSDGNIEIISGLNEGDKIIIDTVK